MSAQFPAPHERRSLRSIARRFTLAATAERRADLDSILDEGVRFLQACRDAGMPADYVDDSARGLHDQLSILFAGINRDLDDVGEPPAPPLEMCELEELFQTRAGR